MLKDGIYFDLPEDQYRADPALSQSGIATLLSDPEEFWYWSHMNPDRPQETASDAMERGKLWHKRILEPHDFDRVYAPAPWIAPDFFCGVEPLKTVADMKGWLSRNDVLFKSNATKSELEQLVIDAIPTHTGKDTPHLVDRFEAEAIERAKTEGRILIYSKDVWNNLLAAERAFQDHPYFKHVFAGGYSEVSIFWTDDTGIRLKARIDKLKAGAILDYKTLYVIDGKPMRKAALDAIKWQKYDLQAAFYTLAVGHAVRMIKEKTGVVHGDVAGAFIDSLIATPEKPFGFVFQKESAPFTVRGLVVNRRSNDQFNVFGAGLYHMQRGIEAYKNNLERFGTSRWYDTDGMSEVLDHEIYYS